MSRNDEQALKNMLRPYLFVLKEGQEYPWNNLDYSLVMLQVSCREKLHSPISSTPAPRPTLADHIATRMS